LIILACGGVIFVLLKNSLIKADFWQDGNDPRYEIEGSFGTNYITFEKGAPGSEVAKYFALLWDQKLKTSKKVELSGFQDDVNLCDKKVYKISKDKEAVCFQGSVGVHSNNLELIEISSWQPVPFVIDNKKESNIVSDVPNVVLIEGDNLEIETDSRNYDTDPLSSALRAYFIYKDGEFVFDKNEDITYDLSNK